MTEMTQYTCHDCGCKEGELHKFFPNCDMEICPFCGGQFLGCECYYKEIGIRKNQKTFTVAQEKKFKALLKLKGGRIRYIQSVGVCARCGVLWPEMFTVPDEEWNKYMDPWRRGQLLCWECYDEIRVLIDGKGKRKRAPLPLGYDDSHVPLPDLSRTIAG
jgi:hypothetical protein